MKCLPVLGFCAVLLATSGCGEGPEYVVSHLALNRTTWDTLSVDVQFAQHQLFGKPRPAEPQALSVVLFNAAYDTLYTGDGRLVPVNDQALGDQERLMMEVCGRFDTELVCEQESVAASPKRLILAQDILFPEDAGFERGSYDFRFVVERQVFDAETWERLAKSGPIEGYLLAYVGAQSQEAVKVPFSRRKGRFNLRGNPHYDDFDFHLRSALMDQPEASVHFDVYAGLSGQVPAYLASVEKVIHNKTPEERKEEVRFFAEQAADVILERMIFSSRDQSAYVYVDDWTFNTATKTYAADLEIVWQRRRFLGGRTYELQGRLEVAEDGANARFHFQDANERTRRRWRSEVKVDQLGLGTLTPYVRDDEKLADTTAP